MFLSAAQFSPLRAQGQRLICQRNGSFPIHIAGCPIGFGYMPGHLLFRVLLPTRMLQERVEIFQWPVEGQPYLAGADGFIPGSVRQVFPHLLEQFGHTPFPISLRLHLGMQSGRSRMVARHSGEQCGSLFLPFLGQQRFGALYDGSPFHLPLGPLGDFLVLVGLRGLLQEGVGSFPAAFPVLPLAGLHCLEESLVQLFFHFGQMASLEG